VRGDESLKESIAFFLTTSSRDTDISAAYQLNAAGYFLKDNINDLVNMLSVYSSINMFPETGQAALS
jgi:DNA-binding NarL/FixJ family response regulator